MQDGMKSLQGQFKKKEFSKKESDIIMRHVKYILGKPQFPVEMPVVNPGQRFSSWCKNHRWNHQCFLQCCHQHRHRLQHQRWHLP